MQTVTPKVGLFSTTTTSMQPVLLSVHDSEAAAIVAMALLDAPSNPMETAIYFTHVVYLQQLPQS